MKITAVKCLLLSAPYATPGDAERIYHLRTGMRSASIIKVETDDGLYGLGETYSGVYAPEAVAALVHQFQECLLGQDASNVVPLWHRMQLSCRYWGRMGLSQSVLGGIEMALWDLLGKKLRLPVHALLGGKVHDAIRAYASGGNDKPEDELRAEMKRYLQDGFTAVKIRINNLAKLDDIVSKVAICRDALGPEVDLAVDAAQGLARNPWSVNKAVEIADAISPYRILWLEEPAEVTNYSGFAEIRLRVSIPVAGGETVTSLTEAEAYIHSRALDLFQPDATLIGGLTAFRRVADMCHQRQIRVAVHTWCSGVGIMGNYHAAFASPNCDILELPNVPNPLRDEFLVEPLKLVDCKIPAPNSPGLGVTLPNNLEEKYAFKPGTYYKILGALDFVKG